MAVSRAFTAVPLHACVGAIMGYYVGQAWRFPAERMRYIARGYGFAVLLHMLYDFPLMAMAEVEEVGTVFVLGVCTMVVLSVGWFWALRLVRRLHAEQLAHPPALALAGDAGAHGMTDPVAGDGPSATTGHDVVPPGMASAAPEPLPVESDAARIRRRITGISVCIVGGGVASFGGMVTLGLLLAFAIKVVRPEHVVDVAIGGMVSGVLPLVAGVFVFRKGVKHLNQRPG